MIQISVVIIVCCVCAVCVGYGVAVFRAFFTRKADRVAYRMAGVWAVCFAAVVVGCLMLDDAFGAHAAAGFAAVACAFSYAFSLLLDRRWRNREMAAAVAYLHLYRAVFLEGSLPVTDVSASARLTGVLEEVPCTKQPQADVCREVLLSEGSISPLVCGEGTSSSMPSLAKQQVSLDTLCAMVAREYDLTRREEDVLKLLIEGSSMADVAQELVVSANTVKSHVRHIYRKMGVNRKQDLCDKVFGHKDITF